MEIAFEDGSLMRIMSNIPDPRMENKVKHPLSNILFIAICAITAGAEGWSEIVKFGKFKLDWLRELIEPDLRIPSVDTFARVFSAIDPEHFKHSFIQWIEHIGLKDEQIAIDGKTIRRSFDRATEQKSIHLVNAWAVGKSLFMAQEKVDDKSNEITAIPKLLDMLDLKDNTVTIDAMGCQKKIAEQIIKKDGDYILALKGNQGQLYEDIKFFFEEESKSNFKNTEVLVHEETDYGHGRIETRLCTTVSDIFWIPNVKEWKGMKSITRVRVNTTFKTDGKKRKEADRYYISSLSGDAKKIGDMVRGHWGIENSLHWVLDVTFNEDHSRLRRDNAAENFSFLRKMVINMCKQENKGKKGKEKKSIRMARKVASWSNEYLLAVLGASYE